MLVPSILRCDRATENFSVGDIQMLLCSSHPDDLASVGIMYGRSTHNQRIEAFWSYLLKQMLQEYIDMLMDLGMIGLLDQSSDFVMDCLMFCFINVI